MITIQVDDRTAEMIKQLAKARGLSVSEYLRSLLPQTAGPVQSNWDEIEQEILSLSTAGPPLPPNFSRADIYRDHD